VTHNTLIYDIRHFVCKDIYLDTLLFSVIHFVLSLGRPILMEIKTGPKMGVVHWFQYAHSWWYFVQSCICKYFWCMHTFQSYQSFYR